MNSTLLIFLAALCAGLSVFLALASLKLETFNRARLRRLRESRRALAEELEDLFPVLPRLRLGGHLLLLLSSAAAAVLLSIWFFRHGGNFSVLHWCLAICFVLVPYLAVETLDAVMSLYASALLLKAAGKFIGALRFVLAPLVMPLELLARRNASPKRIRPAQVTVEDEILSLVEDSDDQQNAGASKAVDNLESDEKRMLNGVINLDKTLVHEIMTPRVDLDAISDKSTIEEARRAIAEKGHSRIPVFSDSIDAICGILYAKDLLNTAKVAAAASIKDLLHAPVFIPETKNVGDLLDEFRTNRNHMAVVLDEYGGTSGIVTIEDILEEIVGEIHDEYDKEENTPDELEPASDGTLTVDARMPIWELNQAMDLEIPETDG
ncbi:MAG: HlyC/CorC family transporter, partial [Victivallales bacterium]|nr:HlyC/CorC family transporter [Victivallales bacterium]